MYPKMYILVNTNFKMSRGKIAGQCCHAACMATRFMEQRGRTKVEDEWLRTGETKIVLQATESIMLKFQNSLSHQTFSVYDLGRTQIPYGSFTALAFLPLSPDQVPDSIKDLKLL